MIWDIYVLSAKGISLLPTDEEMMHYKEHGCCISKPLFNEEPVFLGPTSAIYMQVRTSKAFPAKSVSDVFSSVKSMLTVNTPVIVQAVICGMLL